MGRPVPYIHHNFDHRETRRNDATLLKLDINRGHAPPDYVEGVVVSELGAQVRLTMHLESKPIVTLPIGTKVKIYEIGKDPARPEKLRAFAAAEITSVVLEEKKAEMEKRKREECGQDNEDEDGDENEDPTSEDEDDEDEEDSRSLKSPEPLDMTNAKLVTSQIKGWISLKEGGDLDRDIVELVATEETTQVPYTDIHRLNKVPSHAIPSVLKCKVIGEAGCVIRSGPQLGSSYVKRLPKGTFVMVKNVARVSDEVTFMNSRVYVEQMPEKRVHGFEYLAPYNLEVAQPRQIGTPYDGEVRISKPVECSEEICELLGLDKGEKHSKVDCREGVERYVREHKLVKVLEDGRKAFDFGKGEEGRKLCDLLGAEEGEEITFGTFQRRVDRHVDVGTSRATTAASVASAPSGPLPFKVELKKGDDFLYYGWTSLASRYGYPILEPECEHLSDFFSPDAKRKHREKEDGEKSTLAAVKKDLLAKLNKMREEREEKEQAYVQAKIGKEQGEAGEEE